MANHVIAYLKPQLCLEFLKPTKIRILLPKSASRHGGFPEACMDPSTRSGILGSVTGENRKLRAERILNSADSIPSYN